MHENELTDESNGVSTDPRTHPTPTPTPSCCALKRNEVAISTVPNELVAEVEGLDHCADVQTPCIVYSSNNVVCWKLYPSQKHTYIIPPHPLNPTFI